MFGVRCWMFSIFFNRHQFHPAFGAFTGMVPHHFGMHDAGVLRGFRFRSLRQARGGGTGGRSDRDDEAAISSINLSPPSDEKIKAAVKAKNNESPTVQPEQHWRSWDLTGSLSPQ